MKPEYVEGPEALQNFEQFASAILQARNEEKKRPKKAAGRSKPNPQPSADKSCRAAVK